MIQNDKLIFASSLPVGDFMESIFSEPGVETSENNVTMESEDVD